MDLFDYAEGKRRRDKGIAKVLDGATARWKRDAMLAVLELAKTKTTFTSDDLWAMGIEQPHHPNAIGAVFRTLAGRGHIRKTGNYKPSQIRSRHAAAVAEWEGA